MYVLVIDTRHQPPAGNLPYPFTLPQSEHKDGIGRKSAYQPVIRTQLPVERSTRLARWYQETISQYSANDMNG